MNDFHPSLFFILGALVLPFLKGKGRQVFILLVPVAAFVNILFLFNGIHWVHEFMGYPLVMGKVDRLSLLFASIFAIASFIGILFAIRVEENWEQCSALLYAGSAIGVVFAGALIALFIFWEVLTLTATTIIFARRRDASYRAGLRYLFFHVLGGLALLIGIIMYACEPGALEFVAFGWSGC